MGIRIRKILGYGFDDLIPDDTRFNIQPINITRLEDGDDSLPYEDIKKLVEKRKMEFLNHLYVYGKQDGVYAVDYYKLYDCIRENKKNWFRFS